MDAYDLFQKLKEMWAELSFNTSGSINKSKNDVIVCVWTEKGYKQVTGIVKNKHGFIELELEDD